MCFTHRFSAGAEDVSVGDDGVVSMVELCVVLAEGQYSALVCNTPIPCGVGG